MYIADENDFLPSGVANPYVLVELILGREINWKDHGNPRQLIEETLQTPYKELFDPKFDSPLYLGLRLDDENRLERARPALLDIDLLDPFRDIDMTSLKQISDLANVFRGEDVLQIKIEYGEILEPGVLHLRIVQPKENRRYQQAVMLSRQIISTIAPDPTKTASEDFTPANLIWSDNGSYFNEAAEFFEPIQGAVANCYLIAALAAVAWARPHLISHATRATRLDVQESTNMFRFYDVDKGIFDLVEVTDTILRQPSSNCPIYCRSSETGEIWPAVYEKAYAKWKTGISGDHPDIPQTVWGDSLRALKELTGFKGQSYRTAELSADELWEIVRANSRRRATFNPMVACTYASSEAAKDDIAYEDANLVASHSYSVLGWEHHNGCPYIILRNPWGRTEAVTDTPDSQVLLDDVSWWRPIMLTDSDGVFALEAEAFKRYFQRLAVVK